MVTMLLLLFGGILLCAGMALLTDSIAANLFRPENPNSAFQTAASTDLSFPQAEVPRSM